MDDIALVLLTAIGLPIGLCILVLATYAIIKGRDR